MRSSLSQSDELSRGPVRRDRNSESPCQERGLRRKSMLVLCTDPSHHPLLQSYGMLRPSSSIPSLILVPSPLRSSTLPYFPPLLLEDFWLPPHDCHSFSGPCDSL